MFCPDLKMCYVNVLYCLYNTQAVSLLVVYHLLLSYHLYRKNTIFINVV